MVLSPEQQQLIPSEIDLGIIKWKNSNYDALQPHCHREIQTYLPSYYFKLNPLIMLLKFSCIFDKSISPSCTVLELKGESCPSCYYCFD
ncbi:unnamed protein product [Trichobilharzia regenti]|nr:unnamed protein product [Trichobilharzia regenti]